MAFCKSKLSDVEDSKDESCNKDSLEYERALDKVIDRGTLIEFHKQKWDSKIYHRIGQLVAKRGQRRLKGSGCIFRINDGSWWLISSAHNLILLSSKGSFQFFDEILMFKCREGENSYQVMYKLDPTTVRIHPCYDGDVVTGFDVAMCKITTALGARNWEKVPFPIQQDTFLGPVNPKNLQTGREVWLNAYPSEKDGFPYTSSGKITNVVEKKKGGWLIFYTASHYLGVSGGPISLIVEDEKDSKELGSHKSNIYPFKQVIGVHIGYEPCLALSFGTLITKPLHKWMNGTDTSIIS